LISTPIATEQQAMQLETLVEAEVQCNWAFEQFLPSQTFVHQ
jgi:hypothetical protein